MLKSFYRAVVQAILFYGSKTWVLLVSIAKSVERTHTEFLIMITRKRERQLGDSTWETPGAEVVQEVEGTQLESIYIERHQENVAQWVALRSLFEVSAR